MTLKPGDNNIENIVWFCRRREIVTLDSVSGSYRFNVNSPLEAERFADIATFACRGSSGGPSAPSWALPNQRFFSGCR